VTPTGTGASRSFSTYTWVFASARPIGTAPTAAPLSIQHVLKQV